MSFVVDDEYCREISGFSGSQGKEIDDAVESYLRIMKDVRSLAIISGGLSDALREYSQHAGRLSGTVKKISDTAARKMDEYIFGIEEMDQFIF